MNEKARKYKGKCRIADCVSLVHSHSSLWIPLKLGNWIEQQKKRCVYLLKLRDSNSNGISKELYKHNQKLWNNKKSSGSEQQQLQQSTA